MNQFKRLRHDPARPRRVGPAWRRVQRPIGRLLAAGGLAVAVVPALWAADPSAIGLVIQHQRSDWQYPDRSLATTLTAAELQLTEPLAPALHGSLHLRTLELSQPDNPLPAARSTTGEGIGISFQARLLSRPAVALDWNLAWRYTRSRGQAGSQQTEFVWHHLATGLDVSFLPHARLALVAGASLGRLVAEQRDRGPVTRVLAIRDSRRDSYHAGLRLHTGAGGSIELKAYAGASESLSLAFRRRF